MPVAFITFHSHSQAPLSFTADPAIVAFLQGAALVAGALLSLALTQKIAVQPLKKMLPQHLAIAGGAVLFWQLMV